ncbi:MAG TPA: hypothetical protein VIL99_10720 [Ignavibacteria bacterium]|jgi:hypothetical protein
MIKNQFGRRNLLPYVRAELALKLEGFYKKKALENISADRKQDIEQRQEQELNNFINQTCPNSDKIDLDSLFEETEHFPINENLNSFQHDNRAAYGPATK